MSSRVIRLPFADRRIERVYFSMGQGLSRQLAPSADAFRLVLQMKTAGRYRYVDMEAEKSFRGEAVVRRFRFFSESMGPLVTGLDPAQRAGAGGISPCGALWRVANSSLGRSCGMSSRRWVLLLLLVVVICSIAAGTWYYRSKCHGMDACAAADAESQEREKPSEPQ
jgi:hypothetical protein